MDYVFEIMTPLGFSVHCTKEYWDFIVTEKHPYMKNLLEQVKNVLSNPDEIRKSKKLWTK